MKIAFIIFDGITWLDFIGVYDPISRLKSLDYLPDLDWDICGYTKTVKDSFGLEIKPDKVKNDLSGYDAIIVPGGYGTRALLSDEAFLSWIKTGKEVAYKASVCTGSLLLGAAGLLEGKKATTHFQEYQALKPYCQQVLTDRIVADGDVITAGAVTSAIDLGLYLAEQWSGKAAAQEIRQRIDYR